MELSYYNFNGTLDTDFGDNGTSRLQTDLTVYSGSQLRRNDMGYLVMALDVESVDPKLGLTRFFEFDHASVLGAFDRVVTEMPSARLLVVGSGLLGGEEERFLALAQEAGLASRVACAGWRERSELAGYFAASDLAILPLEDTLLNRARCPAKLVDLMAAELPVVVGTPARHLASGAGRGGGARSLPAPRRRGQSPAALAGHSLRRPVGQHWSGRGLRHSLSHRAAHRRRRRIFGRGDGAHGPR